MFLKLLVALLVLTGVQVSAENLSPQSPDTRNPDLSLKMNRHTGVLYVHSGGAWRPVRQRNNLVEPEKLDQNSDAIFGWWWSRLFWGNYYGYWNYYPTYYYWYYPYRTLYYRSYYYNPYSYYNYGNYSYYMYSW